MIGRPFGGQTIGPNPRPPLRDLDDGGTSEDSDPLAGSESRDMPITETDFAEFKDGSVVELVEDSQNLGRKCLAAWKDGEIRGQG